MAGQKGDSLPNCRSTDPVESARVALVELVQVSGPDLFASWHFRHNRFDDGSANGRVTQALGHLSNLARILGGVFLNQLRDRCWSACELLH